MWISAPPQRREPAAGIQSESRLSAVAFFVLLSASTWAWVIAADLIRVDHLFVRLRAAIGTHKLQICQFLVFLLLNMSRYVDERLLGGLHIMGRPVGPICSRRRPIFRLVLILILIDVRIRHGS